MSKNWKRMIQQWWGENKTYSTFMGSGGGFRWVGLNPSKLFILIFNFPYATMQYSMGVGTGGEDWRCWWVGGGGGIAKTSVYIKNANRFSSFRKWPVQWALSEWKIFTIEPTIALSLHENMHHCTIKIPPKLDFLKITIELWTTTLFFLTPAAPNCTPCPLFCPLFF